MAGTTQYQRLRGAPNGPSIPASLSSGSEGRNGEGVGPPNMSRAEKFEDEKRRIIESCFSKTDTDGSISESYITHIRIVEDAAFPSSPPPPQSPQENKKPRIVIVAVRKSGRVRMHKARENGNGTFSIGKTWNLDDLTTIESYTGAAASTLDEEAKKEWAGTVGFLVTIQKPYYWQATTAKEKDFFIGSLVKIYRKYTGGKIPQLNGFTQQELGTHTGGPGQRPKTPVTPATRPSPISSPSRPPPTEQPPTLQPIKQRDASQESTREPRPFRPGESNGRKPESRERAPQFPPSEFVRNLRPPDSQPRLQSFRLEESSTSDQRTQSPGPPSPISDTGSRSASATHSTESFASRREQQANRVPSGTHPSIERLRTNGAYPPNHRNDSPNRQGPKSSGVSSRAALRVDTPPTSQSQVPERRRPPVIIPNGNQSQKSLGLESPQEYSTPSGTPTLVGEDGAASPRSMDRPPRQSEDQKAKKSQPAAEYFPHMATPTIEKEDPSQEMLIPTQKLEPKENTQGFPSPLASPPAVISPTSLSESPAGEEIHRPGLGPMIKKKSTKDIANQFRKAAMAHNAFKPRSGGAVAKLKDDTPKSPNTPDGINGVFPAPSLLREPSQTLIQTPTVESTPKEEINGLPEVRFVPLPAVTVAPPDTPVTEVPPSPSPSPSPNPQVASQEDRRRKRPSNHSVRYAKALGIDPSLLEGRTLDFESALSDFGWGEQDSEKMSYDDLQNSIRRDLAKVETGSWLGGFEHNDERVAVVGKMLDKAISECEELDGLLTLYNAELGTLSEDVAYIEAQSQGLQVQTANQRLLHSELQNLLENISISASQLQVLKDASLAKPQGIQSIETALVHLYKAMMTIDPKLRQNGTPHESSNLMVNHSSSADKIGSEISTMRAVKEKQEVYRRESINFVQRFKQFMSLKFQETENETFNAIEQRRSGALAKNTSKLDIRLRDQSRAGLWMYSPLMLFARESDFDEWEDLMRSYENSLKRSYQEEYRDNIAAWKRVTKKPNGEEQEVLFTAPEKESESIVSRKLTVKRSKTVRADGSTRNSSGEKPRDLPGSMTGYEAFAGALYDMSQSIFVEQNFIVNLFHVSSLETVDFADSVAAALPASRQDGNFLERKLFDPDRQMAKRLQNSMEDVYAFWPAEMENLVNWVVNQDTLQGVGVLFALETKLAELEETNQDFLTQTLSKILSKLTSRFDKFVDEQIRAIEDTKVKIKKRKGVIAFIKTFPYFSSSIENMLPMPRANNFEVRHMANEVYARINKAMFESLKFIAKEAPAALAGQKNQGATVTAADTEDKEILNYHILLIENMNHYIEEVDIRSNPTLDEWKVRATVEMEEHMNHYIGAVIRRPLGKLLDFIESTESILTASPDGKELAARASHSRSTFKKILSAFDAKEIRRGIDALKKRVEKHFGDADDPGISKNLVQKVLRECENEYGSIHDRTVRIAQEVYEPGLEIEWKREDVGAAFRR